MGTCRRTTAIAWLSLFLQLLAQTKISNAGPRGRNSAVGKNAGNILLEEIVLQRQGNETKVLGAAAVENPAKVNEEIFSLINGSTDLVFPNNNSSKDQDLAQSEAVIVSLENGKDLEDLDHALAFSEYESRKIDTRKDKRKISNDFEDDRATTNEQIKTSTLTPYVKPYYVIPRGFQSSKRNFYQEGPRPVTSSYQKVSQPLDREDSAATVVTTEASSQRFSVDYQPSLGIYKSEEGFTPSTVGVPRTTYSLPTRRTKNHNSKAKENIEEIQTSVNFSPKKSRKNKKKVKSLSLTEPTVVTTPVSVYNYTVPRRRPTEQKSLSPSVTIQPVAFPTSNEDVYKKEALAAGRLGEETGEKSNSRLDNKFGLLKKYDVPPRPFSYTVNHGEQVEKAHSTSIRPGTAKSLSLIDTRPNDKINRYKNIQASDYKYKKEGPTQRPGRFHDKYESSSEETASKADLTSKESEESKEDVEESIERPQRRNDSYEVSETGSSEDDYDSSADSERYERPETSKRRQGYHDDYDRRHVRQSQGLKRQETDQDRDSGLDVNYEETRQDQHNQEYGSKDHIQNNDQDKEGAGNYEHSEKSGDHEGDKEFTKGGETEQEESHYHKHGNKGKKGYNSWHEHDKAEKGHHDKEEHSKEYDEKDGEKKEHEEDGGYQEEYHKDEKGQKEAEFNEKGEHNKGHSTKGQHSVHKKDEYEKKTEFFDEYNEDGDMEKDGEFYTEHEEEHGGKTKSGHHDEADEEEKHGKMKKFEETEYHREKKGKDDAEGKESHYDHEEKYGKKGGHESGKKWMMEQGSKDGQDGGGESKKGGNDKHGD